MWAVKRGNAEVVALLVLQGADVDLQNSKGDTAVHLACQAKAFNGKVLSWLLHAGPNLQITNKKGAVASSIAEESENSSALEALQQYEASYAGHVPMEQPYGSEQASYYYAPVAA